MKSGIMWKIGIIGLGFLGGSLSRYFQEEQGINVHKYDKNGTGSVDDVNKADIIFVCVNTPFDAKKKQIDLSYVDSAIKLVKGHKIIVIRSTVPPGTTDAFQTKYSQHKFLFVPEFLRAAKAYEDLIHPCRQVVGYTKKSKKYAEEILELLPRTNLTYVSTMPASQAELLKYASNVILSTKVAIANIIYDFANVYNLNYECIADLLRADERIGDYGFDKSYEGFIGYNGTCFPKDVRELISFGEYVGVDVKWLKEMDNRNLRRLKSQNIKPNYGYPKK